MFVEQRPVIMKISRSLPLILLLLLPWQGNAQCTETPEYKVLLVGDSWAFFMGLDQTINRVLTQWGHSNYRYLTNLTLAENGAETDDFLKPEKRNEIAAQLLANPSVEVVHLSIGGNDYLGDWNVNFTPAQTEVLLDSITNRLTSVIQFIKSVRPGIHVFFSGYTYPNFEEIIQGSAPFQTFHPFYGTWADMGFPKFHQINQALLNIAGRMEAYTATDPYVHFVNAPGILQYTFGQTATLGVPPSGSYPPQSVPLPFGKPDYPSPRNSMRDYLVTKDCFHLSPEGYQDFVGYHFQKFYHKFLMGDRYFLLTNADSKGSVSAQGVVTPALTLGKTATDRVGLLLGFHTAGLEEKPLSAAGIFLQRKSLSGASPVLASVRVKIKHGYLGDWEDADAADWAAEADAEAEVCVFGSNTNNGWLRLDLPPAFFPHLRAGQVQFLVKAYDAAGVLEFADASDPDFAPVLSLTFDSPPSSFSQPILSGNSITLYPNPTRGGFRLESGEAEVLEGRIFTPDGRACGVSPSGSEFELTDFPPGAYWVRIQLGSGVVWKTVVKI